MTTVEMTRFDTVPWTDRGISDVVAAARRAITDFGIVRISAFPTNVNAYRNLLENFGEPLGYYGDDAGTHPDDSATWRIKYDPAAAASGETHAVAGPLAPHSSQSLRDPRPKFFSMLMVNGGWHNRPFGQNGESVLVPWRWALQDLRRVMGKDYDRVLQTLMDSTEFPDGCHRSVVYELSDAVAEDDLGVRLKGNQLEYLLERAPLDRATAAVSALAAAAERTALRLPLRSGDLILLDNDRWGHGRESVVGFEKDMDGSVLLNPRELWSVTVA